MTEKRYQITRGSDGSGYVVCEWWDQWDKWWPVAHTLTLWGARWVVRRCQRRTAFVETYPNTPEHADRPALSIVPRG